ncbi:MAG: DUF72 domain-containing protein [Myxococcota bacterium]
MSIVGYRLGCPAWGLPAWRGTLLPSRRSGAVAPDEQGGGALTHYARVFSTVEGNTTFYAVPSADTVARWDAEAPSSFRFCFKFPRSITHDLRLEGVVATSSARAFLTRLEPLHDRLGPTMLQLPPGFGPARLGRLETFLDGLPSAHRYAVEVRHPEFFAGGDAEARLEAVLAARRVDWVTLDTRGLFLASREDRHVAAAQSRKPRLPVRARALGPHPIVRFVPHPDFSRNRPFVDGWRSALRHWLDGGREPYFFMHAPDDRRAPELARRFHAALRDAGLPVGEMPPWSGEAAAAEPDPSQLGLFS